MKFTHVFISRPHREAEELAAMLAQLGLQTVTQPAFDYVPLAARTEDPQTFTELEAATAMDLVVFTSPRAVTHGLAQLPRELLHRVRIAAIGPATASALVAAGVRVAVTSPDGFTSEALLEVLAAERRAGPVRRNLAFVLAAPGGRKALVEGLAELGWQARMLMVYRSQPAELDQKELALLEEADGVLSVWTSGNAMDMLSQRLPPAIWLRLCQGEWLVISERLSSLARAFGPARVHLASGPGNGAIVAAIHNLL